MLYIEAINYNGQTNASYPSIFLAGGITGCPDWQAYVIDKIQDLNINLYNPRRKTFNVKDKSESINQIRWEYKYLNQADQIVFWFPEETVCPITLFELGAAIEREYRQKIIVGCHPNYSRKLDLEIQLGEKKNGNVTELITDLDKFIKEIIRVNSFRVRFDLHGIKGFNKKHFQYFNSKEEAEKEINSWILKADTCGGYAEIDNETILADI